MARASDTGVSSAGGVAQPAPVMVSGDVSASAGRRWVQVGSFAEGMTAGRGYVAIAIVVLGRWHPVGVALGSLFLGVTIALQYLFQALDIAVPYQLFLMLPYALTLLALAGAVGRVRAPGDLGR